MEIFASILPVVLNVLLPVITVLVAWGVRQLVKKLDVESKVKVDELVDKVVARAVDCVEQLNQVSAKLNQPVGSSQDKLVHAINIVAGELQTLGITQVTGDIIRTKIEAYLQRVESM